MNNIGRALLIGAEDEENLAIRYLGGMLKSDGHQVLIVPYSKNDTPRHVLKTVRKFQPHMVAISMAFQSLAVHYLKLARSVKNLEPSTHLTVGGHFPTFEYPELMEYDFIDSIIRFEGEKPLSSLMKALLEGGNWEHVPHLVFRKNGKTVVNGGKYEFPNLDNIPYPLRNDEPQHRLGEKFSTLITSRGCFHSRCVYCCIGAFHQKKTRKFVLRREDDVAREMKKLYQTGTRLFQFHDDNFLLSSPEKSLKRLHLLERSLDDCGLDGDDIAILIKTRPDALDDEIMDHLVDLGVIGVFLGVENASNRGLTSLGRGCDVEEVEIALKLITSHEMAVTFNLLMFHPRASLDEINENIIFMKNNQEYAFDFGRAEIVAGSPLERYVKSQGLLLGKWPSWDYRIKDNGVEKMFRIASLTFYHPESIYSELAHQVIALSYHGHVLRKLHEGPVADKYGAQTLKLIKQINGFKIESLVDIYRLTALKEFDGELEELFSNMNNSFQAYLKQVNDLSLKMRKYQLMDEQFRSRGLDGILDKSKILKRFF